MLGLYNDLQSDAHDHRLNVFCSHHNCGDPCVGSSGYQEVCQDILLFCQVLVYHYQQSHLPLDGLAHYSYQILITAVLGGLSSPGLTAALEEVDHHLWFDQSLLESDNCCPACIALDGVDSFLGGVDRGKPFQPGCPISAGQFEHLGIILASETCYLASLHIFGQFFDLQERASERITFDLQLP